MQINHLAKYQFKFTPVHDKDAYQRAWNALNSGYSEVEFNDLFINEYYCTGAGVLTGTDFICVDNDTVEQSLLDQLLNGEQLPPTLAWTSNNEEYSTKHDDRAHKWQRIYRVPNEYQKLIFSKTISSKIDSKELDFRYGTQDGLYQQSVIVGKHPITGYYQFLKGHTPNDIETIPELPQVLLDFLLVELSAKEFTGLEIEKSKSPRSKFRQDVIEKIIFNDPKLLFQIFNNDCLGYGHNFIKKGNTYYGNSPVRISAKPGQGRSFQVSYVEGKGIVWIDRGKAGIGGGPHHYKIYCQSDGNSVDVNPEFYEEYCKELATLAGQLEEWNQISNQQKIKVNDEDIEELKEQIKRYFSKHNDDFDIYNILPEELAREIINYCNVFKISPILGVAVLITICSSLLGSNSRIVINNSSDFIEPPIIWLAIVGCSDNGKSPLLRKFLKPLQDMQYEGYDLYTERRKEYDVELKKYEKRQKNNENNDDTKPVEPKCRFYYFDDFTQEALVSKLEPFADCGSLIKKDELAGLFVDKYSKNSDKRPFLLQLYDGGSIDVTRKTSETIMIRKSLVSVVGGIQPSKIKEIMEQDGTTIDGLWQRFLYFEIKESVWDFIENRQETNLTNYLERIYRNLDRQGANTYLVSSDATDVKKQWHYYTENFRINTNDENLKAFGRKSRAKAYRIALVLHCIYAAWNNIEPSELISSHTLSIAISIVKYSLNETVLLYGSMGKGVEPMVEKIVKILQKFGHRNDWITLREIQRLSYTNKDATQKTKELIEVMVKLGYCNWSEDNKKVKFNDIMTTKPIKQSKQCFESVITPSDLPVAINNNDNDNDNDNNINQIEQETVIKNNVVINESLAIMTSSNQVGEDASTTSVIKSLDIYDFVKNFAGELVIFEQDLDLNYKPVNKIPSWVPSQEVDSYEKKFKVYLDIETTGLDPQNCKIIMIGLRFLGENNHYINGIYCDLDEKTLLEKLLKFLESYQQIGAWLIGHNIFNFDLPFIIARCNHHNLKSPFKIDKCEKTITAASDQFRGKTFIPIYLEGFEIIDTIQQVAIWDKQASRLAEYGLKPSVLELGLRQEQRLELDNAQIQQCYENGELDTIKKYLAYDLEDTELLANFLLPVVYYQLRIVPKITMQQLAVASPAKKVQKIHESLLPNSYPKSDPKVKYQGAKVTLHRAGIFRQVAKLDVSSLYPSIMLRYGLCSRKDPEKRFLGVLDYMRSQRLKLKALAKEGNVEADFQQGSLKILINGSYGYFGTNEYSFNDYGTAALITAYGRLILSKMEEVITEQGGVLIESDTDGVIFSHNYPENILKVINETLPAGIECELEYAHCVAAIPKAKNYSIVKPCGKVITKGAKRSDIPLLKQWKIDYLKAWQISEVNAEDYHYNLIKELESGNFPIELLTITKRIPKNATKLVELGIGKPGEKCSYYFAKDTKGKPIETNTGPYNVNYYIEQINKAKHELIGKDTQVNKQLALL